MKKLSLIFNNKYFHYTLIFFLSFLFVYQIFENFNYWGLRDWDQDLFWIESPIKVIKDYFQLPLWNPWHCGGNVLFQNPQVPFLTPFTFLYFFFDTPQGIKISILLHYIIALIGMYFLGRHIYKIKNVLLIIIAASLFVFNSFLSLHLTEGHTVMLPCTYIPFLFLFFIKYIYYKKNRFLILCSLVICLIIFEGGVHIILIAALFLGLYSLFEILVRRNINYLIALLQIGLLSFLLASIKLIPLFDFMLKYPRYVYLNEKIPLKVLSAIYFHPDQRLGLTLFKEQGGWHEYGCYIGIPLFLILLMSLISTIYFKKQLKHNLSLIFCLTIFTLLLLGHFYEYAPYSLIKNLPFFKSFRMSGRFSVIITFIASLIVFSFMNRIEHYCKMIKRTKFLTLLTLILVGISIFIFYDLFKVNSKTFNSTFPVDPKNMNFDSIDKFHYKHVPLIPLYGAYSSMYLGLKKNIATINCYEVNQPERGFDATKLLVSSTNNSTQINNIKFTPNKISFNLKSSTKSIIFLNQNYVRGWKFNLSGVKVKNINNLPSIEIEKGKYDNLYFYYMPNSIYLGLILTIIGIILSILITKFKFKLLF